MTAGPGLHPMTVAGVVGRPINHSLSPQLHGRWIAEARLDAAYVPFNVALNQFESFIEGMRGGAIKGVNVTLPFKLRALNAADMARPAARAAGSANLLLFNTDGSIEADNTDGVGLLYAFESQAPGHELAAAPVVILGAGGAARGAAAALRAHGVGDLRIINRTTSSAHALAEEFEARVFGLSDVDAALKECGTLINTTSAEITGSPLIDLARTAIPSTAVVMDMLYRPLKTQLLRAADLRGLKVVDGLDMLIGQAIPSFQAFYGVTPHARPIDRVALLAVLGESH